VRKLPRGIHRHPCGKYCLRLHVYGDRRYFGLFAKLKDAKERLRWVNERWPDRLIRFDGPLLQSPGAMVRHRPARVARDPMSGVWYEDVTPREW
jgi:hypothetical protein